MGPALDPHEPEVADVVLPARVGAARDVDAHAADVGQAGLLQGGADVVGQAAGLGHGQVAGVGARAGHDVPGQFGAGLVHAQGDETLVERAELVLDQAAEDEVLPVGDPDLDAEAALEGGHAPELLGGHVTEAAMGVGGDGPLGHAPDHVGRLPALVPPLDGDRVPSGAGRRRRAAPG